MSSIKRMKVSFIDKDTMCAVDPNNVVVGSVGRFPHAVLVAYELLENGVVGKEYEIKFINSIDKLPKK